MRIHLSMLAVLTGETVRAVATTQHSASSYGQPVLLVAGQLVDWELFELAEPLRGVLVRAYEAGVTAERAGGAT